MGCKTRNTDVCGVGFGSASNPDHCSAYSPGEGTTLTHTEYPVATFRTGNYNIPGRDDNAVMYGYTEECITTGGKGGSGFTGSTQPTVANCGKLSRQPCTGGTQTCTLYQDYVPKELSFDFGVSDTFMSYLYDTSDDAGHVGKACYYIITRRTSRNDGGGDTDTTQECVPCQSFSCTTASTTLRYTAEEDLTGDVDCPHPTLFGVGTTSNKLVFEYDSLSSELPDGVNDLELSYDGVTYLDGWDGVAEAGIPYTSSQNPWQVGDENFEDFEIFELNSSQTVLGLRVKVRISPIFDDTTTPITFSGTRWVVEEILASGTNYTVGDVFSLTYDYTHPDSTTTTLTLNLRVAGVGPVSVVTGQSGFDVLRTGDTINGHVITHTFHTDIENFAQHVLYLDGNGNDFVKNTQYTSSRNHVITAVAGYGITDRACLIGKYEFLNKSIQYTTGSLNRLAPDIYNELVQPQVTFTITNGQLTSATIVDGGSGWDNLGETPELVVSSPGVESGRIAEVIGVFLGGQLIDITITDPGSGYTEDTYPAVYIRNIFLKQKTRLLDDAYVPEKRDEFLDNLKAIPRTDDTSISAEELSSLESTWNQQTEFTDAISIDPRVEMKMDQDRRRIRQLPQKHYSEAATEPLRNVVKRQDDFNYLNDAPLDRKLKQGIVDEAARDDAQRQKDIDDITQKTIPEFSNTKETYIERVQGSFSNLPEASQYTKYHLRQYRADTAISTSINITLSCTPVDIGCGHITCPPPATPGNTFGSFEEPLDPPDPNDPDATQTVNTTTVATVSALLGPGCQSWSVSGNMTIFHELSRAAVTVSEATAAYGNPY